MRTQGFRITKYPLRRNPQGMAKQFKVRRNPTYIFVMNGKEVRRGTGAKSVAALKSLMRKPLFPPNRNSAQNSNRQSKKPSQLASAF